MVGYWHRYFSAHNQKKNIWSFESKLRAKIYAVNVKSVLLRTNCTKIRFLAGSGKYRKADK